MSMDDQSSAEATKANEESVHDGAEADDLDTAEEAAPVAANDEGEPQSDLIEAQEEEETEDDNEEVEEAMEYELDEEHVRMAEALLFAASEPLDIKTLADRMPEGIHITTVLEAVQRDMRVTVFTS